MQEGIHRIVVQEGYAAVLGVRPSAGDTPQCTTPHYCFYCLRLRIRHFSEHALPSTRNPEVPRSDHRIPTARGLRRYASYPRLHDKLEEIMSLFEF